jgi:hypothetical protein
VFKPPELRLSFDGVSLDPCFQQWCGSIKEDVEDIDVLFIEASPWLLPVVLDTPSAQRSGHRR